MTQNLLLVMNAVSRGGQ